MALGTAVFVTVLATPYAVFGLHTFATLLALGAIAGLWLLTRIIAEIATTDPTTLPRRSYLDDNYW